MKKKTSEMTIAQYETEQRRLGIAAKVADGAGAPQDNPTAITDAQTRAQQFKENRRAVLGVEETRAVLVSGGKLATPTEVNTATRRKLPDTATFSRLSTSSTTTSTSRPSRRRF